MAQRVSSPPLPPQAVYSHSKVTLTCRPAKPLFVAGQHLDGVLEIACSSEKVWLGHIGIELRGAEQLHSRDHAASQAFLQSDVAFQSAHLPPSNAVVASATSISSGFWPARNGVTRFPFSFGIPHSCPSSCKFAGNASVTYTLLATCQIQLEGERQILTRRLDVNVVERWDDWANERFHEPSEAQIREKLQSGAIALAKTEGTIFAEAVISDRFFYRGWERPDGSLEFDRARGEIYAHLSVKNCTNRTLPGLKITLLRRLKILPSVDAPSDVTLVISAASAPRITEVVEEIGLHSREWEFPPSTEERTVDCRISLPVQEKFLSVRKTKLFELHTILKISLETGNLNKPVSFELPVWVAHWASLPPAALQTRQALPRQPPTRHMYTRSFTPSISPSPYQDPRMLVDTFGRSTPQNRSPFPTPQLQPIMSPRLSPPPDMYGYRSMPSSPMGVNYSSSPANAGYISFDPHAADVTPSRFMHQPNPWMDQPSTQQPQDTRQWVPMQSPVETQFAPITLASSAPAFSYFALLAQQRMTPSPGLPIPFASTTTPASGGSLSRSYSADPRLQNNISYSPHTQRQLPQRMQDFLTQEEQARVIANSAPAIYDVSERANALRQQEVPGSTPRGSPAGHGAVRQRRQSMPTPPSTAQIGYSPVEALPPSRPLKTPPLAPSSRYGALQQGLPAQVLDAPEQAVSAPILGLETIGEDGESQAGTIRIRKGSLIRSASHEQIRSIKAIKAPNSAIDEEGNTSVSFLEGIAEQQDREKEAANRREAAELGRSPTSGQVNILAQLYASSPKNGNKAPTKPVPDSSIQEKSSAKEGKQGGRKRIFDIFPEATTVKPFEANETRGSTAASSTTMRPISNRVTSGPVSSAAGNKAKLQLAAERPNLKPSKSDSLLALESRLSRPSSPMSPTFGMTRPPSFSPPLRTNALSPVQRAISPVHIGNEGALRKKSSQLSMKRQNSDKARSAEAIRTEVTKEPTPKATTSESVNQKPGVAATTVALGGRRLDASNFDMLKKTQVTSVTAAPVANSSGAKLEQPQKVGQARAIESYKSAATLATSPASSSGAIPRSPQRKAPALAPRSPQPAIPPSSPALTKRYASDPQTQTNIHPKRNEAAAPRRQSLDALSKSPPDVDKFGSARGGRGGKVTAVSSLWADIIAQESQNGKNDPVQAAPMTHSKVAASVAQAPGATSAGRATTNLRKLQAGIPPQKQTGKGKSPLSRSLPATAPALVASQPGPATRPLVKTTPAIALVNATLGKAPTFAKQAVTSPLPVVEQSAEARPGASNLKALIAKFS